MHISRSLSFCPYIFITYPSESVVAIIIFVINII